MNIFVNTAADATQSLIVSINNNNAATILPVFVGDVLPLTVTFTDGQGNLAKFAGQAGVKILFAIGIVASRRSLADTGTMNYLNGQYSAVLDLNTNDLKQVMGQNESVELNLEIQASFFNDTTETLCQQSITVRNQLIV